jgi:hypothetical protein
MNIYITCEGTKLTAESTQELLEKLYQAEPNCSILFEQSQHNSDYPQKLNNIKSENLIAELIQNDLLSVIDPIDG